MAVPPVSTNLSPAQVASIPSASLPLGPQLSHLLQQFTTLSLSLFQLLSASTPAAASQTSAIYDQLAELDQKLAGLLAVLALHQRRQRRVEQLAKEVKEKEEQWQRGARGLHDALEELTPIIKSGALDRASIASASAATDAKVTIDPKTLLSYARLLAPFTSAPPSSLFPPDQQLLGPGAAMDPSGRTLPVGAIPPFPTEGAMRRGRLQFAASGLDEMGERGEVGARKDAPPPEAGAAPLGAPPKQDAAARLTSQAKQEQEQRRAARAQQQREEQEEFVFDLDLNPDL